MTEIHISNCNKQYIQENIEGLSALLSDSIEHGASVGFLENPKVQDLDTYWLNIASQIEDDEFMLWVARDQNDQIIGSVQLARCPKANGRHRGDVMKLFVLSKKRRKGLAIQLMHVLEEKAKNLGLSLLVLDTSGRGAEILYEKLGYTLSGHIPNYAADPDGSLHPSYFYFKPLANKQ